MFWLVTVIYLLPQIWTATYLSITLTSPSLWLKGKSLRLKIRFPRVRICYLPLFLAPGRRMLVLNLIAPIKFQAWRSQRGNSLVYPQCRGTKRNTAPSTNTFPSHAVYHHTHSQTLSCDSGVRFPGCEFLVSVSKINTFQPCKALLNRHQGAHWDFSSQI